MKRILSLILIITLLIIPQTACNSNANNNQGVSKTSFHLDTVCTITIYSMDASQGDWQAISQDIEKEALRIITQAFGICDDYEKILSRTIEGSDVYNINHAGAKAVTVSQPTLEVIQMAMDMGKASGGAFDVTIGAASDLWDFHQEDEETGEKTGTVPSPQDIEAAIAHVGYENIIVQGDTVRLADSKALLDLGGIAKGYIADKVVEYLESQGVTSAVVDLGGNIVTIGNKAYDMSSGGQEQDQEASGTDFAIGIADPLSETGDLLGILKCKDKTVVTSGTYERYFEVDGKRYHHVLSTVTGYPVDTDLLAVTVIGDKGSSALCDGLSTSCLALGLEAGMALIEETPGVEAIFVDTEGNISKTDDSLEFEA